MFMEEIIIELGVGNNKRHKDSIGIDIIDADGVDIVGRAEDVLKTFANDSIDAIYCYHFLEHVDDVKYLIRLIQEKLKWGGSFNIVVPHWSNPYFFSDPTHKTFFGYYTMSYYARDERSYRKVPKYIRCENLLLEDVSLVFKVDKSHFLLYPFYLLLGALVNLTTRGKEIFEFHFAKLIPVYEIKYKIKKG